MTGRPAQSLTFTMRELFRLLACRSVRIDLSIGTHSMNLIINVVWVGPKKFGWLECFIVYAWRMWGCQVNVFTHSGPGQANHDHESLGLPPNVCNIIDLPSMVEADESSDAKHLQLVKPVRSILIAWYKNPLKKWGEGGQQQIYNMVDMTKSYLASTRQGIVIDLKIGPSRHLKTYVDKGVFANHFVSYVRAGNMENQCIGTMKDDPSLCMEYAKRFMDKAVHDPVAVKEYISKPDDIWFNFITGGHMHACSLGGVRAVNFLDIGICGKASHEKKYGIYTAHVRGIAGEDYYGPLRIFKKESDQTNKSGAGSTTPQEQMEMRDLTFRELADASIGDDGGVDVTARGMPPIVDMLNLLKKTG